MLTYEFLVKEPISYHYTGKFESPSANWVHANFNLTDYELFVMTKGTLYLAYNNENFVVHENEMLLLPPLPEPYNRRYGYQPSDCSFYWLHFMPSHDLISSNTMPSSSITSGLLDKESKILLPNHYALPQTEKVIVLMKQLQDAIRLGYNLITLNYMTTIILCEIYHQCFFMPNIAINEKKTRKQVYNDIVDYIKQNTHMKLTVAHIASHFGYNEKYLSHMFSTISQVPLKQFILKTKLDTANFLLMDTNMSIRAIAESLGFTDNHHFMKCYKQHTGLTPSEYRNAFSKRLLYHK